MSLILDMASLYNETTIVDGTPIVLYAMGLPLPDDMDGRVITDMFEDAFLTRNPIRYTSGLQKNPLGDEGVYDDDDSREMKQLLRNLGYMA